MRWIAVLLLSLPPLTAPEAAPQDGTPGSRLDAAVEALKGFSPAHASGVSDDAEFLRRAMLDLLGYPPDAGEAASFLADSSPDKRAKKIDALLATPRFADFWARRFAEVFFGNYHEPAFDVPGGLRIETRRRLLARFIDWLRDQIHADRPWAEIVALMISARGTSAAHPEVVYKLSFYGAERQEFSFAAGLSRHLLGTRLYCAQCHDHPHDRWTTHDFFELAAFNTRQRLRRVVEAGQEQVELSYADAGELEIGPKLLDAGIIPGFSRGVFFPSLLRVQGPKDGDRSEALARLLPTVENGLLSRAAANRVWTWLMGRGVVEPVDDFSLKHKPVSEALIAALRDAFDGGKGSLKALIRTISGTRAYQRSSAAEGACEVRHFCRGAILPLSGEQMLNSIQVALRGAPGLDLEEAQQLTAHLTMRPRVGCEVEPLPCGTIHALMLRNSEQLWDWIKHSPVLGGIRRQARKDEEVVDQLFQAVLSRNPGAMERARYRDFIRDRGDNGVADACWTLINTAEFLTRH